MKKPYQKPEVLIESFELSQSIASCYYKLNYTSVTSCMTVAQDNEDNYIFEGGFLDEKNCTHIIEDYCWTNGSGMHATYMS